MNAPASPFDPHEILHDQFLSVASAFDAQAFLGALGSPLASLRLSGTLVSQILERTARDADLDVRVLLVKLQVEQSLLTARPTPDRLDWAMGYGLTDDGPLEEYRDFVTQVTMAARAFKGYLDPVHPFSVVDQVGKPMNVRDGLVVPKNAATAALYRYTPWIGDKPFEELVPPFGNYLFWTVWKELFGFDPRDPGADYAQAGLRPPPRLWRVIAPPDNWRSPIEVTDDKLALARELAARLNLVATADERQRKLYLGLPPKLPRIPPPRPAGSVLRYPSGVELAVVRPESAVESHRYTPVDPQRAAPLVEADPAVSLSEHFTLGEFLPHDPSYRYARLAPELVVLLEKLRSELGRKPLVVTSGYRPPEYNRSVGGVENSAHVDGLAADIYADHVSTEELFDVADRLVGGRGGVGFYPRQGFVHVDLRGYSARWTQ